MLPGAALQLDATASCEFGSEHFRLLSRTQGSVSTSRIFSYVDWRDLIVKLITRIGLSFFFFTQLGLIGFAQSGIITTYAGPGLPVNGSMAAGQALDGPWSPASDGAGGFYAAIPGQNGVYRVTADGRMRLVAGNITPGFSGDGGLAILAQLFHPTSLALDAAGNLFIADSDNNRIRKVTPEGIISTVAGNGDRGYSGDDDLATATPLSLPTGVALDTSGNLFIADTGNNRIRKVHLGVISTVAGDGTPGFSGDEDDATAAQLKQPTAVAVDMAGNLFFADTANQRIRKVTTEGVISTVAGIGTAGFSGDGGQAASAAFSYPIGLALDSAGNLFIADAFNYRVRKLTSGGVIGTVAGNGMAGFSGDGDRAISAQLKNPVSVAVDSAGNLFIADSGNHRVRKVTSNGAIRTVAGNGDPGFSGDDGPGTSAQLSHPTGVAIDAAGNLFIVDHDNNRIRKVTPDGVISTVVGIGTAGFSGDGGPAISAQLNYPMGITADAAGNLFIADYDNNRIRKVTLESSTANYFPQVVAGDGYSTLFTIRNTGSSAASGVLRFTDPQGNPLSVKGTITDSARITQVAMSGSVFPVTVPARARVFLSAAGVFAGDPVNVGWGQLESTEGTLTGAATLEYVLGSTLQTVAGVLQSQLLEYATLAVDNDGSQGRWISYAIANPSNQPIDIEMELTDRTGRPLVTLLPSPWVRISRFQNTYRRTSRALNSRGPWQFEVKEQVLLRSHCWITKVS